MGPAAFVDEGACAQTGVAIVGFQDAEGFAIEDGRLGGNFSLLVTDGQRDFAAILPAPTSAGGPNIARFVERDAGDVVEGSDASGKFHPSFVAIPGEQLHHAAHSRNGAGREKADEASRCSAEDHSGIGLKV